LVICGRFENQADSMFRSRLWSLKAARQFEEYVWFDETHAITPLDTKKVEGLPDTYPFGG
jgi:hypothetical protein